MAQAQKARSSSTARSLRVPVAGSSIQIISAVGRVRAERVRTCPSTVKWSPGGTWLAARSVLDDLGEAGYRQRWGDPFPRLELQALHHWLSALPAPPKPAPGTPSPGT